MNIKDILSENEEIIFVGQQHRLVPGGKEVNPEVDPILEIDPELELATPKVHLKCSQCGFIPKLQHPRATCWTYGLCGDYFEKSSQLTMFQ